MRAVDHEPFVVAQAAPVRPFGARPLLDALQPWLRCGSRPPALEECEHGVERARCTNAGVAMIEVYSWATPNGHKVHIMLEECALPYKVVAVDIGAGDQFKPEFLAISPNNKIPALRDPDGPDGKPLALFESGAI